MDIVNAKYIVLELLDLVWRKSPFRLGFNEDPMDGNDVDDQHQLVKLPQACAYAQLLSAFAVENSLELSIVVYAMNMQSFTDELNKMYVTPKIVRY